MSSSLLPCLAALLVLLSSGGASAELQYEIEAEIDLASRRIDGRVRAITDGQVAGEVCWLLYPNRFKSPDSDINDFSRRLVYPEESFDPGKLAIDTSRSPGRATSVADLPQDTIWLQPAATAGVAPELWFSTTVPHRFGVFGEFGDQLTLLGGWHPVLCGAGGRLAEARQTPTAAHYLIRLRLSQPADVVLNGSLFRQATTIQYDSRRALASAALIVAPRFEESRQVQGATEIVVLQAPAPGLSSRLAFGPTPEEHLLATVAKAARQKPPGIAEPEQVVVVIAPLRLRLTASAPDMVVVSDRAFHAHSLIVPFHQMQTLSASYATLIDSVVSRRERPEDIAWVRDGLAREWATRLMDDEQPERRDVYGWIDRFNLFAIVDRFETAPRVPFVEAFFERTPQRHSHDQFGTFNHEPVAAVVLFDKLRNQLGQDDLDAVVDRCTAASERFVECAAQVTGQDIDGLLAPWMPPFPRVNYAIADYQLNQPVDGGFRQTLRVRRTADRPVREPVPIQLHGFAGAPVAVAWNAAAEEADVSTVTPGRVYKAVIDPTRQLTESNRADNAVPIDLQAVLDTAEVEVSSTEFGFAGLAVLRQRYDYTKDLALALSYTNRALAAHIGARWHFGAPVDANSFHHNIYAFYVAQALDGSFEDHEHKGVRSAGHNNGLGLRYEYSDVFDSSNPTRSTRLRLFGDVYDRALGSDYSFADWGVDAVLTQPLWSTRTLFAAQVLNGFSTAFSDSVVPLQSRYSLGGSRSIRGIGAEDELARNIFVVRAELRQSLYPEFDLSFFDLAIARRLQVLGFVDSGRVSDSAGRIYNPAGFAVGAGLGLGLTYEFFGFFPAQAYIAAATRIDRSDQLDNVQVLFGSRQAF